MLARLSTDPNCALAGAYWVINRAKARILVFNLVGTGLAFL